MPRHSLLVTGLSFVAGAVVAILVSYLLLRHPAPRLTEGVVTNLRYGQASEVPGLRSDRVLKFNAPIPLNTKSTDNNFYVPPHGYTDADIVRERSVVASASGFAVRRGERLWLGFDNGTSMVFIDDPICQQDISCSTYTLAAFDYESGLYVVRDQGWEWFSALVISKKDGTMVRTEGMPVFSADRKYAAVSYWSFADGSGEFSVYAVGNGRFTKEASCDVGPLEYFEDAEWIGPETAIISQSLSSLKNDQLPMLHRIDGKWRVTGPVTPTRSGKKDEPMDFECKPPK